MRRRVRVRVNRSYGKMVESLWQVWKIEPVREDPIWSLGQGEHAALKPDDIRVAVWNICKGAGGVLFEHDYRILSYLSDFVLLQEALMSHRSLATFCSPGFEVLHGASYMRRDRLRDGVMTASRVKSLDARHRIICKYPEPVFNTPKAALVSFYPIAGHDQPLMVVNLHATLIRGVSRAVEELLNLMAQVPAHDGPVLLAGDFNTFTANYLKAITSTLEHFGLVRVPIDNDPRSPFGILDQVFVRGLAVQSIEVDTTIASSDHFPLVCRLKVDS